MMILLNIFIFISAFLMTEFLAWFSHKYIMHGFLWFLHKDHHVNKKGVLEHNDWFSLIFAFPSFLMIYLGIKHGYTSSVVAGSGMAAYGLAYFIVHDIFIHQRISFLRNTNNRYLKAIRRAHKMHHKHTDKEHGESFGFLIVNRNYFKTDKNSLLDN